MEAESRPILQACFINGKTCRNGKRDDFDVNSMTGEKFICNKWVLLRGIDPQTGNPIDTWCCNEFAQTKLALEATQVARQNTASTDKVAGEILRSRAEFIGALPPDARERIRQAEIHLLEEKTGD